jgi:hypothetical protein
VSEVVTNLHMRPISNTNIEMQQVVEMLAKLLAKQNEDLDRMEAVSGSQYLCSSNVYMVSLCHLLSNTKSANTIVIVNKQNMIAGIYRVILNYCRNFPWPISGISGNNLDSSCIFKTLT